MSAPAPSTNVPSDHNTGVDLDAKIQSLTQELQDEILDYVLPTTESARIDEPYKPPIDPLLKRMKGFTLIDRHYKPLVGLQLNRAIRERFAKKHYAKVDVDTPMIGPNDGFDECKAWLKSMTTDHKQCIKTIVFSRFVGRPSGPDPVVLQDNRYLQGLFCRIGHEFEVGVLQLNNKNRPPNQAGGG